MIEYKKGQSPFPEGVCNPARETKSMLANEIETNVINGQQANYIVFVQSRNILYSSEKGEISEGQRRWRRVLK